MLARWPVEIHGGLPVLQESLAWRRDVPLYMTGFYAALATCTAPLPGPSASTRPSKTIPSSSGVSRPWRRLRSPVARVESALPGRTATSTSGSKPNDE